MDKYYTAAEIAKSIAAGVTAFIGTFGTALADSQLDGTEVGGVIAATLIAAGVVFRIPNKDQDL